MFHLLTSRITRSLPAPSPNITQSQFLLRIDTSESSTSRGGQAPLYVFSQGTLTTCQFATAFTLVGTQLYADGQLVSTSPETSAEPLMTSSFSGSITDGVSVVNGVLKWNNPAFSTDSATFCLSASNTVFVLSDPSVMPSGCVSISLEQVPCKLKRSSLICICILNLSQTPNVFP